MRHTLQVTHKERITITSPCLYLIKIAPSNVACAFGPNAIKKSYIANATRSKWNFQKKKSPVLGRGGFFCWFCNMPNDFVWLFIFSVCSGSVFVLFSCVRPIPNFVHIIIVLTLSPARRSRPQKYRNRMRFWRRNFVSFFFFFFILKYTFLFSFVPSFQKPLIAITSNAKTDRFVSTIWSHIGHDVFRAVSNVPDANDRR